MLITHRDPSGPQRQKERNAEDQSIHVILSRQGQTPLIDRGHEQPRGSGVVESFIDFLKRAASAMHFAVT